MEMTKERKAEIDAMDYEQLLSRWRFAVVGDSWFQGESGKYWGDRMKELRAEPGGQERAVAASKSIGW